MSRYKLRTPLPIHFKLRRVIGIDSLMVCILFGEISIFHSRVMGLYSSNYRWFFVCRAVNWEPLGQFTSNFAQLLELIVLRSVYFLVKFRFFIPELWDFIHQIVGDFSCRAVNWEPLGQFTSNFAQLLELIVLWSVYFLVKFRFFIHELWEWKSTNIVWMLTTGVSCALGAAVY